MMVLANTKLIKLFVLEVNNLNVTPKVLVQMVGVKIPVIICRLSIGQKLGKVWDRLVL